MGILVLDSTTKSIVVAMSGAAATTNPDFTAAWADNNGASFTEGSTDGALNGTNSVTLVAAPSAGFRRTVKNITIENRDTAAVTLTVSYNNSGTLRIIARVTLQVGDTWTVDGTFDTTGSFKQTLGTVNLATGVTGVLTVPNGGTGAATFTNNAILKGAGTSAITTATAGTDYLAPPAGTAILKANSGGALANATAGTDYVAPGTATTFTATQTFAGTASTLAMVITDAAELVTVSATAATGTINYDVTTQSVLYYTTNASANWTVNFRGSSGTSLNTLMSIGQSMTVTFLVTQGSTAYYNNAVTVDGVSVTPKYQGGVAWTSGNASGIDAYNYVIIKTGNAAFTVLASQTRFA